MLFKKIVTLDAFRNVFSGSKMFLTNIIALIQAFVIMKIVVGNLKMNILTSSERERYFGLLKKELLKKKLKNTKIVLCPPSVHLENFVDNLKNKNISIGAQNIFWEKIGSYTGEVSAWMVKNLKAEYVIVGHSERKKYFGENEKTANLKIKSAVKSGLISIYCVGEQKSERLMGKEREVILSQLKDGLAGISYNQLERIIIAYEPVWSVGTDVIPTTNEIMEIRIIIRKILAEMYGASKGLKTPILYGGSVNSRTVKQTCVDSLMDGALIGRESLLPYEFAKIASAINNGK